MSTGYTEETILTIIGELSSFQLCKQFFETNNSELKTATFDLKPNYYIIIESVSQHILYYALLKFV